MQSQSHKIYVPNGQNIEAALRFSADVAAAEGHRDIDFSFRCVDFVTPAWMLLIIRTLRSFREDRPGTRCKVVEATSSAMMYAAQAGFLDALGVKGTLKNGGANVSSTFIPVTIRRVSDLFVNQPFSRSAGDIIQEDAERLAEILAQSRDGILFDILAYAIREIIRNVVEHSKADEFLIAAQCWIASGTAEIAIADAGIGIAAGLSSNGKYKPESDAEALTLATRPGVSGAIIPRHSDNAWVNSGYGLYMAKGLADGPLGFVLASGGAAITSAAKDHSVVEGAIKGTCVALRLRAGTAALEARLADLVASESGAPSRASISARVR